MNRSVLAVALALLACSSRSPRPGAEMPARSSRDADRIIRIALGAPNPRLTATRDFAWYTPDGRAITVRGRRAQEWRIESNTQGQVRAIASVDAVTPWQSLLVMRASDTGFVQVNGRRYRGQLIVEMSRTDNTILVVNRVPVEDYLRGVVAAEMGNRPPGDSSALRAQAIASRSFAYSRLGGRGDFDLRASVLDQVYGGVEAENAAASAAVDATRGLVLRHQNRVVDALYFSTCGGSTAEPPEIWRTGAVAYLQRVSDRIGGTQRYYCESAPRFRWTRTFSSAQLNAALEQYLAAYASVPGGRPGRVRHVAVVSQTPSGRVGTLEIETDRGAFPLRGNDIRYVLRAPGGEILSSTYFSVEPEYDRDGVITRVTVRGRGYGHGVGMCQWGAIGRARAGQSFRTILGTYYPGTTIGSAPIQ